MFPQILLQLILILINAFFAATEIAVLSLNEKKLRALAEDGDKKAKKMLKVVEQPTNFLSTIQIGITLAGFLGSAFAADNFGEMLSDWFVDVCNIDSAFVPTVNTVSVILITLLLSYFTLVLGELVPKRLAMKHKEKLANAVCGVISCLTTVLKPIIWLLSVSTNGVLRLFGVNPNEKEEAVSEEDIVIMLDAGGDDGTIKQEDIEYIKNVFKLEHLSAADVMTTRNKLVTLQKDTPTEEILSLIENEGYSRIPVYGESIDNIVGILHTREYLLKYQTPGFRLEDVLLDPEFVPETVHLDALFKNMQDTQTHMVIVLNEYGLTLGVVTMEDILEELVGEIWDEQDEPTEPITAVEENTYRVLSGISLDEFFEFFELDKNEEIESTTVNGWLSEQLGGIPEVGDTLEYENLSIRVEKADEQMTEEISVVRKPPDAEPMEKETEEAAE